jgi:thiamine-phosphate pyrophosphorylase
MHRRQPPRLWLRTDERQGERLWRALERLPRGGGVVFRHYSLPKPERRALFDRVRTIASRRGLVLVVAGAPLAGADGAHGRRGRGLRTASAHNLRE